MTDELRTIDFERVVDNGEVTRFWSYFRFAGQSTEVNIRSNALGPAKFADCQPLESVRIGLRYWEVCSERCRFRGSDARATIEPF